MNPDKNENGAERTDEVRSRISTMLAMADVLGTEIGPDEVRAAALVELPPDAEWFAAWTLNLAQANFRAATLALAGQAPDAVITEIMAGIDATKVTPGRTTLMVAHRLTTIRRVDTILVVDNGRLTEMGAPDDLLAAPGYYARVGGGQLDL